MLKGKRILLGVTGSIAAYKSILLVRLLEKAGAEVKVIMTHAATGFVAPLTFSTLSNNKVHVDLFEDGSWANHVALGRWADIMIIAPASCNTMAKIASGICDNLLQAVYLSAICPVILAPAMDEDMWHHPSTTKNIQTLQSFGNMIIPVNNGALASGLHGDGRMAEPEEILEYLNHYFSKGKTLSGTRVLITAGPTYEALDPVRFIGNHSSGKMGICLAQEFRQRGAEVTLVLGPTSEKAPVGVCVKKIISAEEMYDACMDGFEDYDYIVMAAAVADYTPLEKVAQKIKKKEDGFSLQLVKTKDILFAAGERKKPNQILTGFALETENESTNAKNKLKKKNADFIILNSLNDEHAGFGHSTNKITIFGKDGSEYDFALKSKQEVAVDIINIITQKKHA